MALDAPYHLVRVTDWFPPGTSWLEPEPPAAYWPGPDWRTSSPEDQGVSSAMLDTIPSAVIKNSVLIRHGYEIRSWGNSGGYLTGWASCSRSWVSTIWGVWLEANGFGWLDRPVCELPSLTARMFAPDIKLKHLNSYTSKSHPPGSHWAYSCGDHWPLQNEILGELFGMPIDAIARQRLFGTLSAQTLTSELADDGTLRVYGSCRDQARLGYLYLTHGRWSKTTLMDADFSHRATAGGPDGTRTPKDTEAMQIHQWFDGRHTEYHGPPLPVPNDAAFAYDGGSSFGSITWIPSLDIVCAARSGSHPVEDFIPQICQAVTSSM